MKRKLVGGLAVLLVAVAVIWWVTHRGGSTKPSASATPGQRSAKITLPQTQPAASPSQREWARDVDPEGPLRLEGQVVDEGGAGVGGATVWLSSVPPRSVTSEGDGTFAFDKVVGREYSLSATTGDRVGGPVSYRLTAKSDPVVIHVSAGAKVVVEVADDDGKPIANASVKLEDFAETTKPTGADGTVTLAPVQPGWVGVEVTAPGYGVGTAFGQAGSAGATATIHVKLHKGVAVSGRVIDEAGKPVAKAHVTVGEAWWMPASAGEATTDDKGEFTFAALAAGTHVLHAEDGDHAPTRSMPVTVGDRPVSGITITMKDGGSVAGRVVDAQGNGVPYATIRVAAKADEQMMQPGRQAVSEKDGTFEVRGLARVKVQVRASSDDASSKVADVDAAATAHTKDLKLVLDETGTISGIVVDGDGKPVAEVQVTAMADFFAAERPSLAGLTSATTDGAGAFTLRGMPDGPYRLRALRGAGGSMRGLENPGVAAMVGDKNVKLTLPAPATLVGKIQLENGQAPKLANVQLGYHPATPAGNDGSFTIADLEPGKYDVKVLGPEFAQLTKSDVDLTAGKTTDLGTLIVTRGRKLTGRVIDASGTPVIGARVTVSKTLLSMEGAQDQLDAIAEMTGARIATTDQDGAFTIIGIAKAHTFASAEHPDKGRANPVDIAEGAEDPPPVTLALRGFGSITGKVTSKGEPAPGVTITDTLKGSIAQVGIARTADDGTFTLSKVSEGTHVLNAMQMSGFGASSTSATVDVTAGHPSTVTIDIPVGSIEVDVTIKPISGAKLDAAQVFLARGQVTATTAKQLNEMFGSGGMQGMKFWFGDGKPMPTFDQIVAGDYTACGVPITGNMMDPTFAQRLQDNVDILRVYCKPLTVASSPQKQAVSLELPAMTPLPDPKP
jgi:uncharacterized GH25 family protein